MAQRLYSDCGRWENADDFVKRVFCMVCYNTCDSDSLELSVFCLHVISEDREEFMYPYRSCFDSGIILKW